MMAQLFTEIGHDMRLEPDRTGLNQTALAAGDYTYVIAGTPVPALTDGVVLRIASSGATKDSKVIPRPGWSGPRIHAACHLRGSTAGTESFYASLFGRKDVVISSTRTSRWFLVQDLASGGIISATTFPRCVGSNGTGNDILYIEPIAAGPLFDAYTILPHTAIGGTNAVLDTYIGIERET
jgi:hypothetical protein